MPTAIDAMMISQADHKLRCAIDRLLHKLRDYIRVYPMNREVPMPEHDVAWETHIDHGPERTILDSIKMAPDLWMRSLPPEVCIVPRKHLEMVCKASGGLMPDFIEMMIMDGANIVLSRAAQARYEAEEFERRQS